MKKDVEEYSEACKVCIHECKQVKPAEIHYCKKFKKQPVKKK